MHPNLITSNSNLHNLTNPTFTILNINSKIIKIIITKQNKFFNLTTI
jgi:hypothetical protein